MRPQFDRLRGRCTAVVVAALLFASGPAAAQGEEPGAPGGSAPKEGAPPPPPPTQPPPTPPEPPEPPEPKLEPKPERKPEPKPEASARAGASTDSSGVPMDGPAVRALGGNWGIFFRFGGLATMTSTGNSDTDAGVLITQAGMRYVVNQNWIIPFWVGTGVLVQKQDNVDAQANWGLSAGGGFEYHFRIWRRISPLVGAQIGIGARDPSGSNNWVVGIGFGPVLGVEYYVADRVSLIAQYFFTLQFEFRDSRFDYTMNTLAGGALNLVFYF